MPTLAECLKRLGIEGAEAEAIARQANEYRLEEFEPQDAIERAVRDAIADTRNEQRGILDQIKPHLPEIKQKVSRKQVISRISELRDAIRDMREKYMDATDASEKADLYKQIEKSNEEMRALEEKIATKRESKVVEETEFKINKAQELEIAKRDLINQNAGRTITLETVQNSIDAGATRIDFSLEQHWDPTRLNYDHWFRVVDDGSGMSLSEVKNEFLQLGNTGTKGAESVGGYGRAKAAFLLFPDKFTLRTTKDGVTTTLTTDPEQIKHGKISVSSENTGDLSGTEIALKVPDEDYMFRAQARDAIQRFAEAYDRPVEISLKELSYRPESPIPAIVNRERYSPSLRENVYPAQTATIDGSDVVISYTKIPKSVYVSKGFMGGWNVPSTVLNKGVPVDISMGIVSAAKPKYAVSINFTRTPTTTEDAYPFIQNRTRLTESVKNAVRKLINERIKAIDETALSQQVAQLKEDINNAPTVNGTKIILDNLTQTGKLEIAKVLNKYPDLVGKVGGVFNDFKQLLRTTFNVPEIELAITTNPQVYGWRPNTDLGIQEIYAINPFNIEAMIERAFGVGDVPPSTNLNALRASNMVHTMVHEYVHNFVGAHNEAFTVKLSNFMSALTHTELAKIESKVKGIFDEHENDYGSLISDLRSTYSKLESEHEVLPSDASGVQSLSRRGGEKGSGEGSGEPKSGDEYLNSRKMKARTVLSKIAHLDRMQKAFEKAYNETTNAAEKKGYGDRLKEVKEEIRDAWEEHAQFSGDEFEMASAGMDAMNAGVDPRKIFESAKDRYERMVRRGREATSGGDGPPTTPEQVTTFGQDDIPPLYVKRAPKQPGPSYLIRTPSNLFGAIPGTSVEYGRTAQGAELIMNLGELHMKIEAGRHKERLAAILQTVVKDKKVWGKKGERLYEHVVNPDRDGELSGVGLQAVQDLRRMMEDFKKEIIAERRNGLRKATAEIVNREYRAAKDLKNKKLTPEQQNEINQEVENRLKEAVPDTWGYANYLPQLHVGDYAVRAMYHDPETGKPYYEYIGPCQTTAEGAEIAARHMAANPNGRPAAYVIDGKSYGGGDVVRLPRGRYAKVQKGISEAADLSKEDVQAILSGVIGTKTGQQKNPFFFKERKDAPGYTKDIEFATRAYIDAFVRWKYFRRLNPQVQAAIEELQLRGQRFSAQLIQNTFDYLFDRTPSMATRAVDEAINKIPGLRDHVQPRFLDRATGTLKAGLNPLFIQWKPMFHLLNRLQRYQTLDPVTHGKRMDIPALYRSPEGQKILDDSGVRFLTAGKVEEAGKPWTSPRFREKFRSLASETSNQEIAFLTMYTEARRMGMTDEQAIDYGLLRGNLYTQFVPLRSDVPPLFRGPLGSTTFMYKRFGVKNYEIAWEALKQKDVPAIALWMGAQLILGGARVILRPAGIAIASYLGIKAYNEIRRKAEEEAKAAGMSDEAARIAGEKFADMLEFGLPGLIGIDMSASVSTLDAPTGANLAEKIGNIILGPPGSLVTTAIRAAGDTKGSVGSAWERAGRALTHRLPAIPTRVVDMVINFSKNVDSGKYDFHDPAGRKVFETDLQGLILNAMGANTVDRAKLQVSAETTAQIFRAYDEKLDEIARGVMGYEKVDWFKAASDWNNTWPEFQITMQSINRRVNERFKNAGQDVLDRALERAGKQFKTNYEIHDFGR